MLWDFGSKQGTLVLNFQKKGNKVNTEFFEIGLLKPIFLVAILYVKIQLKELNKICQIFHSPQFTILTLILLLLMLILIK